MALPAGAFETSEQVVMFSSVLWNQLVSAGPLITLFSLIVYIALYYQKLKMDECTMHSSIKFLFQRSFDLLRYKLFD